MKAFVIGIDPGRTCGLALHDTVLKKLTALYSGNMWQAMDMIKQWGQIYDIKRIHIENPGLNKPVFMTSKQKETIKQAFEELNQYARVNEQGFNSAVLTIETEMKIHTSRAQKVGRNKEIAHQLIEWLQMNNFEVVEIRPFHPKKSHEEFVELTGWPKRTNEHVRDAARLVIGLDD